MTFEVVFVMNLRSPPCLEFQSIIVSSFCYSLQCFGSVICTWGFCLFIVCPVAGFEACSSKIFSVTGAGWFLVVVVVLVFKTYGFLL
jgi:hypothetical protein